MEAYREAYKLDKPQDVISAALTQLEKAEKVRAYDQLARQMTADSSPEQDEGEAAQAREELESGEEGEPNTETPQPQSSLLSSPIGGME